MRERRITVFRTKTVNHDKICRHVIFYFITVQYNCSKNYSLGHVKNYCLKLSSYPTLVSPTLVLNARIRRSSLFGNTPSDNSP